MLVAQSCPILGAPMDYSPPGPFVHGILQARILEWVTMSFSRDLPEPGIELRSLAFQADSLPSEPPGKPLKDSRAYYFEKNHGSRALLPQSRKHVSHCPLAASLRNHIQLSAKQAWRSLH